MGRRRRWSSLALMVLAAAAACAACNALTGAHDRILDDADAGSPRVREEASLQDVVVGDAPIATEDGEAGPSVVFIEVPPLFKSLNGAAFTTSSAGTTVTAYDGGGANHAVLVPVTQPSIPSDDYTVHATIRAPKNGEFGILTRMQPDGSAFGFGSQGFGNPNRQFLGTFAPPEWAPTNDFQAKTPYAFVPNGRYKFVLKAVGKQISGKLWEAAEAEPTDFQVVALAPWSTGRAIGYYDFFLAGAFLESLRVSVP